MRNNNISIKIVRKDVRKLNENATINCLLSLASLYILYCNTNAKQIQCDKDRMKRYARKLSNLIENATQTCCPKW